MQPSNPQPAKKPYHPPRLTSYGKVRDLTQGLPTGNNDDGSGVPNNNKS